MLERFKVNPSDIIHKDTKLVIDFDSMLFKLASSAEKKEVVVKRKGSNTEVGVYKNKTQFFGRGKKNICESSELHKVNQELIENGLDPLTFDDFEIEVRKSAAIGYTRMFENLNAWVDDLCKASKIPRDNVIYLMGDSGSFRDDLVLPKKYKDNRSEDDRPIMLSRLREMFFEQYRPYMNKDLEADDVLAVYQWRGYVSYLKTGKVDYVVSTIDKDAYGTGGAIINYDKDKNGFKDLNMYLIPHAEKDVGEVFKKGNDYKGAGFKWFIYQALLIGDSGDNYFTYQYFPQLKGKYGKTQAFNDLQALTTPKEVLEYAVGKWVEWFPEGYIDFEDFNGNQVKEPWYEFANKIFLAAYMKRSINDETDLFSVMKKFDVEI